MKAEYKHRETDLAELISSICERPLMYAGNGSFQMAATFISGFAYASEFFSDELREFSFWLGGKFNLPRNVYWAFNLEKIYPNDKTALQKLPVLFEEFRTAKKNGWNFDLEFAQ